MESLSDGSTVRVMASRLAEATKHYERHVLAWYALGRSADARAAREEIARYRNGGDK